MNEIPGSALIMNLNRQFFSLATLRIIANNTVGSISDEQVAFWLANEVQEDFDSYIHPAPEEEIVRDQYLRSFIEGIRKDDKGFSNDFIAANFIYDRFVKAYLNMLNTCVKDKAVEEFISFHDVCAGVIMAYNPALAGKEPPNYLIRDLVHAGMQFAHVYHEKILQDIAVIDNGLPSIFLR